MKGSKGAEGGLAGAAIILMVAFVVSRLAGLVRDMVISYQFGTQRTYEAYLAANRIPDFVFQVVAGGAVASAFIPVFTGYLAREEHEEGWRVVNSLFSLAVLVLVPIVALLMLFTPQVIGVIAPFYDPETAVLASNLARIMLLSPIFFTLGCFATSILNSYRRFALASAAPVSYNVGIICGAWFLAPHYGAYGLAIGAAAGSFLFLLVQVPGLLQVGMKYRPLLLIRHPGVREVGRLMLPRTLGLGIAQINFVVALVLASGMAERYAALNYGWLLTMLPLGVFAMAISTAVFPTLATQGALDQMAEMRQTLAATLRMILFLTIPASIGLIVLRYPIIQLLFERGAFDQSSTHWTAYALQFYAVALFAYATIEIVTRAFYALHDTRTPVMVAAGSMVVNLGFALVLMPFLSHGGLALAMSLAATVEALTLIFIARRRLGGLDLDRTLVSVARTVVSSVLMGLLLWFLSDYLASSLDSLALPRALDRAVFVLVSIGVGTAFYFALSLILGSEEVGRVRELLPAFVKRRVSLS
ncbi:MAG: murein biosynthesis integral membrane protein MurJ [Actinobacteria bacterium]|nr:murein biosynthesis integral membrane protein MurJ [Actinomycetota bacterium]